MMHWAGVNNNGMAGIRDCACRSMKIQRKNVERHMSISVNVNMNNNYYGSAFNKKKTELKKEESFKVEINKTEKAGRNSITPVDKLKGVKGTPYSYLADENGIIEYNGIIFTTDYEKNAICLGDMGNEDDIITVCLSNGGSLRVNRSNTGDLGKAISMFTPEDINRIMSALAEDTHCRRKLNEIEEEKSKIFE